MICPSCKEKVSLFKPLKADSPAGGLCKCASCNQSYRVDHDVLSMFKIVFPIILFTTLFDIPGWPYINTVVFMSTLFYFTKAVKSE